MNITLQPITEENFLDAFNLKLKKEQESFVSHPVRSLAQAYVYRDQCQPFGIYHEDIMVGYVMVIYDYDIPEYDIWHMMIDEAQQDKGYGKAAMQKVLEYIKTKPFGTSRQCGTPLKCTESQVGSRFISLGFAPTGAKYDDEIELVLNL